MYNRYKSQSDGTFLKKTLPENSPAPEGKRKDQHLNFSVQQQAPEHMRTTAYSAPQYNTNPGKSKINKPVQKDVSAASFLQDLIPKNIEVSDMLIILLLLLISNDCPEEHNNALLTLALYLLI